MKADLLDAEWQTGDSCRWVWQRATRVSGFELEEPAGGELVSIVVGVEEQMMAGPVPLIELAQWWPQGVPESPAAGWKIGRIALPSMRAGIALQVTLQNFRGRLRPFGVQVP